MLNLPVGGKSQYKITRSTRLASVALWHYVRQFGGVGNPLKWTFSAWVKRGGVLGLHAALFSAFWYTGPLNRQHGIRFTDTDQLELFFYWDTGYIAQKVTTQVFRDTSAWYHIVGVWDTGNAVASERLRLFVNGSRIGSFATSMDPVLSQAGLINYPDATNIYHTIGAMTAPGWSPPYLHYFDGFLAEVNFVDGLALDASAFGEFDQVIGAWIPKKYTGSYGVSGAYLKFTNNASQAALATDYSGLNNHWNTSVAIQDNVVDVPTNYADTRPRGNYCILNVNDGAGAALLTVREGGIVVATAGVTSPWRSVNGTHAFPTAGDWYFEVYVNALPSADAGMIGVASADLPRPVFVGGSVGSVSWHSQGNVFQDGVVVPPGNTAYVAGNIIGVRVNNGVVTFYKNGVAQLVSGSITSRWTPCLSVHYMGTLYSLLTGSVQALYYAAPAGSQMLCTQNLPEPVIKRTDDYHLAAQRIGTGAAYAVSGRRFAPNVVWTKNLTYANYPALADTVRGPNVNTYSNVNWAEGVTDGITSFNADGWAGNPGTDTNWNRTGDYFADWIWKNAPLAGVQALTWTGNGGTQIVPHNLGVKPGMIIFKNRSVTGDPGDWIVYHWNFGATQFCYFNKTDAASGSGTLWNSTEPTSTGFTVGPHPNVNTAGQLYHALLFAEVPGFSRVWSYTGTGTADGQYVHCGFRPRTILFKSNVIGHGWVFRDSGRSGNINPDVWNIYPGLDLVQNGSGPPLDLLSNGFKFRGPDVGFNGAGAAIIFAAWAETPAKYARAR